MQCGAAWLGGTGGSHAACTQRMLTLLLQALQHRPSPGWPYTVMDMKALVAYCSTPLIPPACCLASTGCLDPALQDYQTPASLLLVAAAAEMEREASAAQQAQQEVQAQQQQQLEEVHAAGAGMGSARQLLEWRRGLGLGYKLLVFLKCCLLGRKYPPGGLAREVQARAGLGVSACSRPSLCPEACEAAQRTSGRA